VAGTVEHVRQRTALGDPPRIHDGDLVRVLGDDPEVVRDQHGRGAVLLTGDAAVTVGSPRGLM
jgi:hypothetical protein